MIATGLAGILIGDSIIFRAGQTYGEKLLDTRLGRHISGERVQRIIHLFEKHGPKFIMAARFVPGLRAVTYFVAGTTGVQYWKFILYDGLAACVSAPFWVVLGWWARKHNMYHRALALSFRVQCVLLAVIALVAITWITIVLVRRRARMKQQQLSSAPPPADVAPLRALDGGIRRS